jgi:hypothetical protein
MLMEAIENGVTVLSLAAILAAPFTEGASLWLLLPIGAVGAIPSAYRLYQRYDEHRLRFDLAAVMDVVNVVAGVLGLAQAATPLRMVRLGRVLMIAGIGADAAGMLLMGAGILAQIDALRDLPEHERAARLIEILGNAMLQIGIQAGGMLMHAHYQGRREGLIGDSEPHPVGDDTPGFHPPRDTAGLPVGAESGGQARSTAGAPPPQRRAPRSTRRSAADARAPARLLERLSEGITRGDYERAPPARDVPNPPPSGRYKPRRRLRSADAAYAAYNEAVALSAGREVGIFHNPQTGEYRVMIGDETGVHAPEHAGWDALVHYHPDGDTRLTFRLPSPHDFQGLVFRYLESGGMVREFVEFDIPGVGRGRTEYGIDPGNPEPFYVRIHRPNESPQTIRFAHDGAYHAYWGDRTIYVEPGSPLHEAMIRDIQAYVRSLGKEELGGKAETKPSEPGATPTPQEGSGGPPPQEGRVEPTPVRAAGDRAAAGAGRATPGRLLDNSGGLTDAGVAFIRRRFRIVKEFGKRGRSAREIRLEDMTDAQIRERFPTEHSWLEAAVVGEVRQSWIGRTTATDFLLDNPHQSLNQVARRLAEAVAAGNTGHTVTPAILERNTLELIRELVAANDPVLEPAWNACENNPALRSEWNRFLFGRREMPGRTAAQRAQFRQALLDLPGGSGEGFGAGRVGNKQPDVIEVLLTQEDALHVLDPSQAWSTDIHNFKTAFYEAVLRRLIDVATVTSTDTGGGTRMRPIGP